MVGETKKPRRKGAKSVVREYLEALDQQDLDRAVATWKPGSPDRIHGVVAMRAPDGIREYFSGLFSAFPDLRIAILEITGSGEHAAARSRITGTFEGPGRFDGIAPTGARVEFEVVDFFRVIDEKIVENNAYMNAMQLAEQLGLLPPRDSAAGRAMTVAFNARTSAAARLRQLRDRRA